MEIVRRLLEDAQATSRGADPPHFFADAARDFEWIPAAEMPGREIHVGTRGYRDFIRQWTEDFESWSFEVDKLVEAPDGRVVMLANQVGVGKSSGARVELYFAVVYEISDGLVRRARAFVDPEDALRHAGLTA